MAKTAFATDDASTVKKWNERLWRDWRIESYFSRFFGSEMDGIVLEKNDFLAAKGDKMTFSLVHRLTGAGVTEGITLEGNEEALSSSTFSLTLAEYAHGVRDRGRVDRQRPAFDITAKSANALTVWGSEKVDALCFAAMDLTPRVMIYTADGTTYLGTTTLATAKAALTAANSKLTLNFISFLKTWAKTGGNRSQTPIKPARVDGKDWYILLTHPDSLFDLKTSTAWQQANREARERSASNPIFTGAVAIWDNVVIHEHENITTFADGGGAAITGCHAHFMGAGALAVAWGMRPSVVQETFDYGREIGHGLDMIFVAGKPTFAYSGTTRDYGTISAIVSRTNVGGLTIT